MSGVPALVIDTNVVLDLFVFEDVHCDELRLTLTAGRLTWLASQAMRDELQHVLGYPHIARRLGPAGPGPVLEAFDRQSRPVEPAPKAAFTCRDPDDQCFIDLAVAHGAMLLSKDAQVLALSRRLARIGITVCTPRQLPLSA